ncbi:MAG: amidase, partial [Anaerolineae bacterium]
MTDANQAPETAKVSPSAISGAEELLGLTFTDAERQLMAEDVAEQRDSYAAIRAVALDNSVPPAVRFDPRLPDAVFPLARKPIVRSTVELPPIPANLEELAFAPLTVLAKLIETRQITSTALTQMYLSRLKRYDPLLHCVVTLTEELALQQAKRADEEIAQGRYRGPLHGIPYGAKDLLATRQHPTTWGAEPFVDQKFDYDAAVIEKLEEAGAVLVAKLTLGALAWGDVWFGGMTRTPWNLEEGSSGSSAGSGSATAAGLVGFAIGTETYGSIISPSTQCRISGLRPTFGRVSRYGAMALSWTMDKIGPMCRTVEDCALVFAAIYGADARDNTTVDYPFNWDATQDLSALRIGYEKSAFEEDSPYKARSNEALEKLRSLGLELLPLELPKLPIPALSIILTAEAGAAFDELTRSGRDDLLKRQSRDAWPNVFRASRLIPAVEYLQAQRVRTLLMQEMATLLTDVDVYVSPSFSPNLLLTNLTGHPSVVVPCGVTDDHKPASVTFSANLYQEAAALRVALAYQNATDYHQPHPVIAAAGDDGD